MANPVTLCGLLLLLVPLCTTRSTPLQTTVMNDNAGSGDNEEVFAMSSSPSVTLGVSPTANGIAVTSVNSTSQSNDIVTGIMDFVKEYMLLIIVVGSLVFVLLFILCAAAIVRQKHKASAYYPSSFPKKKYVDQNDKAGGAKAFSEVPEKASDAHSEEPVDSSKQLQADILAAAQNLKSPAKASLANGDGMKMEDKPPKDKEEGAKVEDDKEDAECISKEPEATLEKTESGKETPVPSCTAETKAREEEPPSAEEGQPAQEPATSSPEEPKDDCPGAAAESVAQTTEQEQQDPAAPDTCASGV
ncbi:transmembrane protein 119 [Alligator sinensis]|uniref:Transmembrane protein 119 n=1 Tax=Alligator sinensis TaxID=38654 RepID=A0A1U7RLP1_ALLSI|nr:transmembrane protein 119 [Alligator sinensis]XP_025054425.1 transmembrane protein 119 [Alligator sinensis]